MAVGNNLSLGLCLMHHPLFSVSDLVGSMFKQGWRSVSDYFLWMLCVLGPRRRDDVYSSVVVGVGGNDLIRKIVRFAHDGLRVSSSTMSIEGSRAIGQRAWG